MANLLERARAGEGAANVLPDGVADAGVAVDRGEGARGAAGGRLHLRLRLEVIFTGPPWHQKVSKSAVF